MKLGITGSFRDLCYPECSSVMIFKKASRSFQQGRGPSRASYGYCEMSRPSTALLPIMEEMTRTEINIPVQSREEGAVATSSCNHEDSGNTPQRRGRTQMWYLARQLRSQAGGHKIWAAVDKVLSNQRKCDRGHWAPPSTTSGQLTSSWSRYSYRLRLHPSTPPACIITPGQWGWQA